jgi:DNA-directed RNA polymerase subunit RPC12/RpoP
MTSPRECGIVLGEAWRTGVFLFNQTQLGPRGRGTGVMVMVRYACSGCDKPVTKADYWCPHCGGCLVGIKCMRCGFYGGRDAFPDDRCPSCGSRVSMNLGSRLSLVVRAIALPVRGLVALGKRVLKRLRAPKDCGRPSLRLISDDDCASEGRPG